MLKLKRIEILNSHTILCVFNSNEKRILDVKQVLDIENRFVQKILQPSVFMQARVGDLGEIVWDNAAEISELDGSVSACPYDISPEFAYYHSKSYTNTQ